MAAATTKETPRDGAWRHLWKIQAALTGATALLAECEIADDSSGTYWAAKELIDDALEHASEIAATLYEMGATKE